MNVHPGEVPFFRDTNLRGVSDGFDRFANRALLVWFARSFLQLRLKAGIMRICTCCDMRVTPV